MRNKIRAIAAILALLVLSPRTPSDKDMGVPVDVKPDIVMIDSGTTKSYYGKIRMERSCKDACWHKHGDQMARALEDEISGFQFDREVNVKHLVWETPQDISRQVRAATRLKPKVIVMAIAGDAPNMDEYLAIKEANKMDITVVAASGNQGGDSQPQFPAGYDLPCLIAVSTKEYGAKVESANLGEIYLERMSGENGTSFSTARSAAYVLKIHEKYGNIGCQMVKALMVREFGSAQ